jgi:hypothetical protein
MNLLPLKPLSPDMQESYRKQAELLLMWEPNADKLADALMKAHQVGYAIGRYAESLEKDATK